MSAGSDKDGPQAANAIREHLNPTLLKGINCVQICDQLIPLCTLSLKTSYAQQHATEARSCVIACDSIR